MVITLAKIDNRLRLIVDGQKIWNDQSLTIYKIIEMINNKKITEDLIIELEDSDE